MVTILFLEFMPIKLFDFASVPHSLRNNLSSFLLFVISNQAQLYLHIVNEYKEREDREIK